ncbi:amidophosphoribosyltransferase [Sulfitobacter sp. LCG007]
MTSQTNPAVAQFATRKIRFEDTTLIGVFGKPGDKVALLRLDNGRIERVKTGDKVGNATVLAIGDDRIALVRGGRNTVLQLPGG